MSPSADDIRRWDAEHVWHPFTQMREYLATEPIVVVRAEGHYLIDDRGHHLLTIDPDPTGPRTNGGPEPTTIRLVRTDGSEDHVLLQTPPASNDAEPAFGPPG